MKQDQSKLTIGQQKIARDLLDNLSADEETYLLDGEEVRGVLLSHDDVTTAKMLIEELLTGVPQHRGPPPKDPVVAYYQRLDGSMRAEYERRVTANKADGKRAPKTAALHDMADYHEIDVDTVRDQIGLRRRNRIPRKK